MRKFHLLLTLVALSLATTSLWAKPAVADENGKLPGAFQIACGEYVYFSQGNLQYRATADGTGTDLTHEVAGGGTAQGIWRFAEEQYYYVGGGSYGNVYEGGVRCDNAQVSQTYTGWIDLFGWATSGWNNTAVDYTSQHYQPWESCSTDHSTSGNAYQYGPSISTLAANKSWSEFEATQKYDWGVYNAISNGGNTAGQWRTLSQKEWEYLFATRITGKIIKNISNVRYTEAAINTDGATVRGVILFPDNYNGPTSDTDDITWGNINGTSIYTTSCTTAGWATLEAAGCVFLPAAFRRLTNKNVITTGISAPQGYYWSSTARGTESYSRERANNLTFYDNAVRYNSNENNVRYAAFSVRLVQDVPENVELSLMKAYVSSDPVGKVDMTYTGSSQTLLESLASGAVGGTVKYKLSTSGSWGTYTSYYSAINAGDYIVQWFVDHTGYSGCYISSDVQEIHVTIAKAPYTPTGSYSVTGNSLTYSGSAQNLVTATNSSNGTLKYSTDGGNTWSTTIPQRTEVGEYTVLYKVVPSNSNYEDYIPEPNTINVSIAKLPYTPSGTYSVTANDLTYDGSDQPLVSLEGSVTDGTVWYKLEPSGEWTTEIPTGNNAGDYSVSYKVVPTDPNYDEYIPTDSPIAVTIAKTNPSATLPESTISIPYDGAAHTLLEVDPVADCVIWYKLGDGDWTTTPPTATDADDYSVQYKIVPNDAVNYNTIGPNTVTVTILDYPTVYDVNVDPTAKLSELLDTPSDLRIKRSIVANDEYNTLCLPFSLDASALAASPLAGFNRLKTLRGAKVTGTAPDLSIDIFVEDATTIEAGIPYLISYPAGENIVDPVFHDVTVTTTTPSATAADGVTFQGMFAQVHINPYTADREQDYLFLGANSQLMWPSSDQTSESIKMRGFRAYFIIDRSVITPALAPKGTRARIVDAPKTATGIENASATFGESQKILENGVLYIIRNGVRYNAQGQIVK